VGVSDGDGGPGGVGPGVDAGPGAPARLSVPSGCGWSSVADTMTRANKDSPTIIAAHWIVLRILIVIPDCLPLFPIHRS